ncbi:Uncharacterized protein QTN25_002766 [Entamoeba marina]
MDEFDKLNRKFAFDQTSEEEFHLNEKKTQPSNSFFDDMFCPENSSYYEDFTSRPITENEVPEELKQRRKGYNKKNKKRFTTKPAKTNSHTIFDHETLQSQIRNKNSSNPSVPPVFNTPLKNTSLSISSKPQLKEIPEPKIIDNFDTDTSVDSSLFYEDGEEVDGDGFSWSIDLDLFSTPKPSSDGDVKLY